MYVATEILSREILNIISCAQTIRQSLHPFWDQTLIFPPVVVHGTKDYIKSLPPEVTLQVYDQDLCVS